jgi:hypothetical protein
VAGSCEHGNEPSGSLKGRKFLDWVTIGFSRRTLLRGDKLVKLMGEMRKPEGKRPRGRNGIRWKDNIKMNPEELGCECVNSIHLAQDMDQWKALVNKEQP